MKHSAKWFVAIAALGTLGVATPLVTSMPQTVHAAQQQTLMLQYGKTTLAMKDSSGQIYPAGTHVVRPIQNAQQNSGSYFLYLFADKNRLFGQAEVLEQFVSPNYTETVDLSQNSFEVTTSPYLTQSARGETLATKDPVNFKAMYRLYNPNSGEHFYTAELAERKNLVAIGWDYEGIGWKAPQTGEPVYRMYNPNAGDHHYTKSAGERDQLKKAGWSDEGVGWASDPQKAVPLYRAYNPNAQTGTHNYTTNQAEQNFLLKAGWQAEGISWYGVK